MSRPPSFSRQIRRLAGLALLAVGPAAVAQGPAGPSRLSERRGEAPKPVKEAAATPAAAPKPVAEADRPGFFGDTRKFSRIGGWGSFGNAMGQFGFARSALVLMPPVQEELKLTDDQKEKLRLWQDAMRKRGEELGRSMREKGGNDPLQGQENPSIAARITQFTGMIQQVGGLVRENEAGLARILKAPQRKRLDQISLQMEGISALTRPDIAESVGLLPDDVEEIQQVLNASRMAQMTTWIGSMMAMRPDRRPGAADPAAKADPKARQDREKAMRQRFETMRDQTDRIQGQAVKQIAGMLSKAQRTKFENLLGPPFDPKKVNDLGRPPRPGTAPSEKPADYGAAGKG